MCNILFLAGGKSKRFGKDKPTHELFGESLIIRHYRQACSAVSITEIVVVCNSENILSIRELFQSISTKTSFIIQNEGDFSDAIGLGLNKFEGPKGTYIVCVNDIFPEGTYSKLLGESKLYPNAIIIPTIKSEYIFHGGMLMLDDMYYVRKIIEKPLDGCPVNSYINVLPHLIPESLVKHIYQSVKAGITYEETLNELIAFHNILAKACLIDFWHAIKEKGDLEIVLSLLKSKGESAGN